MPASPPAVSQGNPEIPEPTTQMPKIRMNFWLVAFCWIVIFLGFCSFWITVSYTFASPANELPGAWSNHVSKMVIVIRIGAIFLGGILAGWRGGVIVGIVVTVLTAIVESRVF